MARNDWDDEDDDNGSGQDSNLVKDLRKQLKEALKAKDELTEQVSNLSKVSRGNQLKDILASKELNPKIAVFYPTDGEATPEAVEAWVKEYADVFGFQITESAPAGQTSLDADTVSQFQRLNGEQSQTPNNAKSVDLEAKLRAATTQEELTAILAQI